MNLLSLCISRARIALVPLILVFVSQARSEIIYVKADATGNNDGTSWEHAFSDLQDALATAVEGDQVWVAQGTYTPAPPSGDRAATFDLISGVGLYGGFAGFEDDIEQRDPELNVTVLSGDLNGDDGENFENNGENSYHVVTANGVVDAPLDGLTITAGHSDGPFNPDSFDRGAALYLLDSDVRIDSCKIRLNDTNFGLLPVIYNEDGDLQLQSTLVEANSGLGLLMITGTLTLENSEFVDNSLKALQTSPELTIATGCVFSGNGGQSLGGGAIENLGELVLTDCIFENNTTDDIGGAILNDGVITATNCLLDSNEGGTGGAIYNGGELLLVNCTVTENNATLGAGVAEGNGVTMFDNALLWGNTALVGTLEEQQFYPSPDFSGIWSFDSCIVEGWSGQWGGEGNSGEDPMFEEGTSIPMRGSPAIDTGNNDLVPDDVDDDIAGNPRFVDVPDEGEEGPPAPVDIGAYEFQMPACEGDANGDGTVDPLDAGYVLARLGCSVGTGDADCDSADQNFDGVVDPLDVGYVLSRFGECP